MSCLRVVWSVSRYRYSSVCVWCVIIETKQVLQNRQRWSAEVCMAWNGLDFFWSSPEFCCFQQGQQWNFFCYNPSRVRVGFCVCCTNINGCLLDLHYAESNKSRIACVMLVQGSKQIRFKIWKTRLVTDFQNKSPHTSRSQSHIFRL